MLRTTLGAGRAAPGGLACGADLGVRLEALRGEVRHTQTVLGRMASQLKTADVNMDIDERTIEQSWDFLNVASEELVALIVLCGTETPLGWRLHDLRNRLDAHLLAIDALRDAAAPEAAFRVLHRSVEVVGDGLERLINEA